MNATIKTAIENSMSYASYRELVMHLVEAEDTTGVEKSESRINFTKLNNRRMKRWDKTLKVDEKAQKLIADFNDKITWLVVTESWCGDAAHVIPMLNKIAELNPNIDMRLVLRDEHKDLIGMFLTNGGEAIPKVIMIDDETGTVLDTYGPRPSEATGYVNRFKAANGALTAQFKEDLQHWYNNDRGLTIVEDITEKLCKFQPSFCR